MKQFGKILFLFFALIFIAKLIVPTDLLLDVEELVELSDDCETEEDNEEEKDELEWKWNLELDAESNNVIAEVVNFNSGALRVGETSEGERVTFSPPPENLV